MNLPLKIIQECYNPSCDNDVVDVQRGDVYQMQCVECGARGATHDTLDECREEWHRWERALRPLFRPTGKQQAEGIEKLRKLFDDYYAEQADTSWIYDLENYRHEPDDTPHDIPTMDDEAREELSRLYDEVSFDDKEIDVRLKCFIDGVENPKEAVKILKMGGPIFGRDENLDDVFKAIKEQYVGADKKPDSYERESGRGVRQKCADDMDTISRAEYPQISADAEWVAMDRDEHWFEYFPKIDGSGWLMNAVLVDLDIPVRDWKQSLMRVVP